MTEELQSLSQQGRLSEEVFCRAFGALCRQLEEDKEGYSPYLFWGTLKNEDESRPDTRMVDPGILQRLCVKATVSPLDADFRTAHAGLLATYGSLLSSTLTPSGYWRDRWLEGYIEHGLALEEGIFSPEPKHGTLLLNVTYFAGRIAFRSDRKRLDQLKALESKAPKSLLDYPFTDVPVISVIETTRGGVKNPIEIHLDFLALRPNAGGYSHLLVYSAKESAEGFLSLINVLPVKEDQFKAWTQASTLGKARPIRAGFSAAILGLAEPHLGDRTLRLSNAAPAAP